MTQTSNPLFQSALEIQGFLEQKNWQFTFTGGLANLRWGQNQTMKDVNRILLTSSADEEETVRTILERFVSQVAGAETLALNRRVLLLKTSNGVGLNVSLGTLRFERRMVERSSLFTFEKDVVLRTCSAEDLIVLKAVADKETDWADIGTIMERHKGKLDIQYILENLRPLCEMKEVPAIGIRIKAVIG